jgi:hypothetical protein
MDATEFVIHQVALSRVLNPSDVPSFDELCFRQLNKSAVKSAYQLRVSPIKQTDDQPVKKQSRAQEIGYCSGDDGCAGNQQ